MSGPRYTFGAEGFGPGRETSPWPGAAPALAGGAGRDHLDGCRVQGAVLDGGPGDDHLVIFNGSASGGSGDDQIDVFSYTASGDPRVPAGAVVDCGPGNDVVRYQESDAGPHPRLDAGSCPPLLRVLRSAGGGRGGDNRQRIPEDYRLRVPLFRASERVKGTAHLVHDRIAGRPGGEACSDTVRFRARPGKAVAVTVAVSRSLIRLGAQARAPLPVVLQRHRRRRRAVRQRFHAIHAELPACHKDRSG